MGFIGLATGATSFLGRDTCLIHRVWKDLRERERESDPGGHSLFVGLQLSAQAKNEKMRLRPVSEEKEVEGLDQGENTCG